MTREALHTVPVLPLEDIHHQRVVPHAVQLPLLFTRDLRGEPLELCLAGWRRLELGLEDNTVEIFV